MARPKRSIHDTIPLANTPGNVAIPQLGFGTYLSPPEQTFSSCLHALREGYRHIDTAQYYGNEAEVGRALAASGIPRGDIFVSTKLLETGASIDENYTNAVRSLDRLGDGGGGYVDLFLIHSAQGGREVRREMWLALERLFTEGRARAIGVSNFGIEEIDELHGVGNVWPPHVNQIELHPWCQQREVVTYCESHGIVLQAYAPIVRNQKAHFEPLVKLAFKHQTSPNQVLIRWSLQKGWVCLPKSDALERIKLNASVYEFDLDAEDMKVLNGLDEGRQGAIVFAVSSTV